MIDLPHLSAPFRTFSAEVRNPVPPHRRTTSLRGAGVRCGGVEDGAAAYLVPHPHPHLEGMAS